MALFVRSTKLAARLTQGTTKCFSRNYADQMSFTFAAANQVSSLKMLTLDIDVVLELTKWGSTNNLKIM